MEAIIAVSVLAITFAGVLQLFTRAISTLRNTNDTVIAEHLAQDAAEFLYAKRRYNKDVSSADDGWIDGIIGVSGCPVGATCGAETSVDVVRDLAGDFKDCATLNGCKLFIAGDGTYTHSAVGTTPTPFTRTVDFQLIDGDMTTPFALEAIVRVRWTAAGGRLERYELPITIYAK